LSKVKFKINQAIMVIKTNRYFSLDHC